MKQDAICKRHALEQLFGDKPNNRTQTPRIGGLFWALKVSHHVGLGIARIIFVMLNMSAILTFFAYPLSAKNFGAYGPTWAIAEENLLDVVYSKLREKERAGAVEQLRKDMTARTKAYIARPKPVTGITRATEPRLFSFDPSITVQQDLADHQGRVFARAGQVVNPLDFTPFNKRIVMLDGDDEAQVRFALKSGTEHDTLLVIINGAPLELTKKFKRRFWFDQDGVMVKRFGVNVVPTVITRVEQHLLIEEVVLDD